MTGIIGKKIGMSRFFREDGTVVPVTLVASGPCSIIQIKTKEKDGYNAVQVGFDSVKEKNLSKALAGHFKKSNTKPSRVVKEFRTDEVEGLETGKDITVEVFENIKKLDVVGISKGHGFSGTVKRYGFGRGRESHGNTNHRAPGSIGGHSYPARVWPGQKLPGQYGNKRITVKNVELVNVDKEKNMLVIKGGLPGPNGGYLMIKKSGLEGS